MPFWLDHAVFILLVVLFPIRARTVGYRRLVRAALDEVPQVRRHLYRQAMATLWTLTLLVVALWSWSGRSWSDLGLTFRLGPSFGLGVASLVVVAAFVLWQRSKALRDEAALAAVRERMRHVERMLPHTAGELRAFYRLSATAGVCEEVLYRGYLIWYLANWTTPLVAVCAAGVVFGLGHSYQGWRGIMTTGVLGVFLGGLYLTTESLYLGMVVHALADVYSGHLARTAYAREEASEAMPPEAVPEKIGSSPGAG